MNTGVIAHRMEHVAGTQSLTLSGEQNNPISSTTATERNEEKALVFYKDWKTIYLEAILLAHNYCGMQSTG
jgi:hypothetical protein